ncbi:MAG: GreA/GreB family elongation factor, partial [Stenotrophobium sp.]
LKVVDHAPADTSRVFFGAWVEVVDEEGNSRIYRIVGADEADVAQGWISVDSPVARALLGRRAGEQVSVQLPRGAQQLELLRIWYGSGHAE